MSFIKHKGEPSVNMGLVASFVKGRTCSRGVPSRVTSNNIEFRYIGDTLPSTWHFEGGDPSTRDTVYKKLEDMFITEI